MRRHNDAGQSINLTERKSEGMIIDSPDYHDYVIKDGKLIGEFEQMYQKSVGIPWHQDEMENSIDVRLTTELLSRRGPIGRLVDYGCGVGYYLDILVRRLNAEVGQGFEISETAVQRARSNFPRYDFQQVDLTVENSPPVANAAESGITTLHVIRGTLWYVFPKIETVVHNLIARLSIEDSLVVVQNFPPLNSNFVGKEVIPNPDALVKHFTVQNVVLESSIWYEKHQGNSNDSWFIGLFKKGY